MHHGNGIQRIFDSDPRVLYISIHRYDYGAFFPCSEDADYKYVGTGNGEGFTINIPWNSGGMGDTEYIAAFTKLILPVAYQFNPELVLVSAGFDAAKGDPLGGDHPYVICWIIYTSLCHCVLILFFVFILVRVQNNSGMLRTHDAFALFAS